MAVVSPGAAVTDVSQVATLSGNELTDAGRIAAQSWLATQQGGSSDWLPVPGGVAVWGADTNLHPHSQCDSSTNWATISSTVAVDATVRAPFSPQSIACTTDNAGANEGLEPWTNAGQAAAPGTIGAASVYFRGTPGSQYTARSRWNNTDATSTDGSVSTFTAGAGAWPTITVGGVTYELVTPAAVAVAAGKTGDRLGILVQTATQRLETFHLAHAMLEVGANIASPYVATSQGVTSSRAAARVQAPATLLDATQAWFALRLTMGWGATAGPSATGLDNALNWWNGTGNERIALFYNEPSDQWQARRWHSGAGTDALSAIQSFKLGDDVTVVVAWTATTLAISVAGGAFVTVANATIPTGLNSLFDIGSRDGTAFYIASAIRWFACGKGVLTDADAAAIAALPDATPPLYPEAAASIAGGWMLYRPVGPKFRRVRVGEPIVTPR